jgi:rod shape-determining protein MreD
MTVRRLLVLGAVLVAAVLVQSTVLAGLRLAGVRPDLLVLVVVAVAMASGATGGAVFGFVAGLVADLLFDLPVGVSALVYTGVGYAVGTVRVYVTSHLPLVTWPWPGRPAWPRCGAAGCCCGCSTCRRGRPWPGPGPWSPAATCC